MKQKELIKQIKTAIQSEPSKALTFDILVNKLKLPRKVVESACRHMICKTGEMEDINAWLRLTTPKSTEPLTKDDVEWLTGTGRYRQ